MQTDYLEEIKKEGDEDKSYRQNVVEFVAEEISGMTSRTRIVAGVNAGWFGFDDPWPLVGYVGTLNQGWRGTDYPKEKGQKWGFGFSYRSEERGQAVIEQDSLAAGTHYRYSPNVHAQKWGHSAVGCLIKDGERQEYSDSPGAPNNPTVTDARTCVAWTEDGHFFLTVCEGAADVQNHGWTWQDVQDFLLNENDESCLRRNIRANTDNSFDPEIVGAMMLDGSKSTSFRYLRYRGDAKIEDHPLDQGRPVRSSAFSRAGE